MVWNHKQVSVKGVILLSTVLLNAIILETAFTENHKWYWALLVLLPLLLIVIKVRRQKKHARRILNKSTFCTKGVL